MVTQNNFLCHILHVVGDISIGHHLKLNFFRFTFNIIFAICAFTVAVDKYTKTAFFTTLGTENTMSEIWGCEGKYNWKNDKVNAG